MRRTEEANYTPEDVEAHLRTALALVEDVQAPDDLRAVCFTAAVNMLSAKQIFFEQAQLGGIDLSKIRH